MTVAAPANKTTPALSRRGLTTRSVKENEMDTTSLPEVEYRELPEHPGYRFGSDGSVWSNRKYGMWRQLRPTKGRKGYLFVGLPHPLGGYRTTFVHCLVLTAFVGPRPKGMECAHENGKPDDNRLGNLSWKTPAENWADRRRHGTALFGDTCPSSKLRSAQVAEMLPRIKSGEPYNKIAKDYGTNEQAVYRIATGQAWVSVTGGRIERMKRS